ncbi:hypothetical protein [Cypionkella sp.]|uniref:hypothetical protein n=1 Tax=Cypionkella sp. TaxID=2811411 RepID=UPI00261F9F3E|nr:hypothetical protein [Cypionkella sp.]
MLALLMTYSDEWEFHPEHLQRVARIGRDQFRRIMGELKCAGYVNRETMRTADGRVTGSQWVLLDVSNPPPENQSAAELPPEKAAAGKPIVGEPVPIRRPKEKEEKEEKNIVSNQSRKVFFPEDWAPSDVLGRWAAAQGFDQDEIANQVIHCIAHNSAHGRLFKDLDAAFKSWLMKALEFRSHAKPKTPPPANGPLNDPQIASIVRQLAAKNGRRA